MKLSAAVLAVLCWSACGSRVYFDFAPGGAPSAMRQAEGYVTVSASVRCETMPGTPSDCSFLGVPCIDATWKAADAGVAFGPVLASGHACGADLLKEGEVAPLTLTSDVPVPATGTLIGLELSGLRADGGVVPQESRRLASP